MERSNSHRNPMKQHMLKPGWEQLFLGRTATPLTSPTVAAAIAGRRVLITGAGGSIGSALARAIASVAHGGLVLLDASEQALYELDRQLATCTAAAPAYQAVLGDAGDPALVEAICREHLPETVFHAAAFKHVPLLEANPFAAVANNILATHTLLQAAQSCQHFLLVSTDKAADPHSIMGASKRVAELLVLAARRQAVRLGNVLGSQGSVLPLFLSQLAEGAPLTITHPDVRRYFMSIDEAVAALLAALSAPNGILVPHLGQPLRIVDLAHAASRAFLGQGAPTSRKLPLSFTGLRPGDKLEETLLSSAESWAESSSQSPPDHLVLPTLRRVLSPTPASGDLQTIVTDLRRAVARRDIASLVHLLRQAVPGYQPSQTILASIKHAPAH